MAVYYRTILDGHHADGLRYVREGETEQVHPVKHSPVLEHHIRPISDAHVGQRIFNLTSVKRQGAPVCHKRGVYTEQPSWGQASHLYGELLQTEPWMRYAGRIKRVG